MGRLSIIFVPILLLLLGLAFILLSKDFNAGYFLPLTGIKWRKVLYSSLQVSTFPLGLPAIFLMIFPNLKKTGKAKVPVLYAVATAGFLVLFSNITYLMVLGPLLPKLTYPGYTAFSYIEVADFLDRAEILFYTIFVTINIVEISLSLYIAANCLAKVFSVDNYRVLLIPLGFLMVEQSVFIVRNHAEHINIGTYSWPWYAVIFEFIMPLILLLFTVARKGSKSIA